MTGIERIEQRLSAVERTLTGEVDIDEEALQQALSLSADVEVIEERLDDLEERIAALEGDVQSVGGYLSEVDAVNADVERQALSAVATVDRLEDRVGDLETAVHRIDPDTRDVQQAIEDSVAAVEGPDRDSPESRGSAGEESGDDDASEASVLERITSESADENGDAADGGASAADGDAAGSSEAATTQAATGPPAHAERGADESGPDGDGEPATVTRRTADQERVDELFDGADEGEDEEGGVLDGLRDRLS